MVPFSGLESIWPSIRYITLLRHPVKRVLSMFQYVNEIRNQNVSLENFIRYEMIKNHQIKMIGGTIHAEDAMENLD